MPSWLTQVMKLVGFTTPLIYAAAAYWFFLWLDKKASGPAKKAISGWLVPKEYDRAAIAAAILELFDWVYTQPLFTWRAFRRSALITIFITLVVIFEYVPHLITFRGFPTEEDTDEFYYSNRIILASFSLMTFIVNVISDYIALFIIRGRLSYHHLAPLVSLAIGPTLGLSFVMFFIFVRSLVYMEINFIIEYAFNQTDELILVTTEDIRQFFITDFGILLITSAGALIVHLWLPLFALCVGLLKGLNYFLLTANTAQWFLKRGKDHPLEAVGFVAAPLVFLGAAAFQTLASR
jgi:hypothetical protein